MIPILARIRVKKYFWLLNLYQRLTDELQIGKLRDCNARLQCHHKYRFPNHVLACLQDLYYVVYKDSALFWRNKLQWTNLVDVNNFMKTFLIVYVKTKYQLMQITACPLGYERIKSLGVHRNICIILCKWSGSCLVKVVYKSTE